jgi:hypothetical protein
MVAIVTDSNWREHLRPDLYRSMPSRVPVGGLQCASRIYADEIPLIPEVEWKERIEEKTAKKSWPQDRYDAFNPKLQYQNGLPYCWAFSLAQAVEIKRALNNLPYIQLGPESLGGSVGWRSAGNYLDAALEWAAKYGIAPRSMVPEHSRTPSRYDPQWETARALFKPEEFWDGNRGDREHRFAQMVTMLLSDECAPYIGLNWWSHAVVYSKLVIERGEICPYTPNSHGEGQDRILSGSRKYPDDLYGIRTVTLSLSP